MFDTDTPHIEMQDQPNITDYFILCILLGTFFGVLLLSYAALVLVSDRRKKYIAKMEERKNKNGKA